MCIFLKKTLIVVGQCALAMKVNCQRDPDDKFLKMVRAALDRYDHRRRIKTEEKAKVVATVWGIKFIQFFAALAILF